MKIGHGFDVHAFQEGGTLVLGGVAVPHDQSLAAHSDGDVILHALCDALLGGAGLGDIGRHFPDSDPAFENIDSRILVRRTVEEVRAAGYSIGNIDITVLAQKPRLSPYVEDMRNNIAADLGITPAGANVKATTTEGLGFTGREEGIAAFAVVLLNEE